MADTINSLIDEYEAWNTSNGLSLGSADEHLFDETLDDAQRAWLRDFVARWESAQLREFTELNGDGSAPSSIARGLTSLGFAVEETGGGCTAWRIALPRGGYVLITDGDGGASHDIGNGQHATIGIYNNDGECVVISGGV